MSKSSETIQQILDAAKACYLADGISKTGMKEVSQAANVARSTLYRHFASRDEVLVAVIKQEMEAANIAITSKLQHYDQPSEWVVEGLILAMREIPQRPLLNAVFASDEDTKARRIIWSSDIIVEFGEQLLQNVIQPAMAMGVLKTDVKPEIMTEWIYRILLSFLTLPSNWIKNDNEMRVTLRSLLIPVLLC